MQLVFWVARRFCSSLSYVVRVELIVSGRSRKPEVPPPALSLLTYGCIHLLSAAYVAGSTIAGGVEQLRTGIPSCNLPCVIRVHVQSLLYLEPYHIGCCGLERGGLRTKSTNASIGYVTHATIWI